MLLTLRGLNHSGRKFDRGGGLLPPEGTPSPFNWACRVGGFSSRGSRQKALPNTTREIYRQSMENFPPSGRQASSLQRLPPSGATTWTASYRYISQAPTEEQKVISLVGRAALWASSPASRRPWKNDIEIGARFPSARKRPRAKHSALPDWGRADSVHPNAWRQSGVPSPQRGEATKFGTPHVARPTRPLK